MIRNKQDIRIREVEHAMGGKGTIFFHDWLLPEEAYGHGRVFSKVVLPPGCSIGPHTHNGEFEAFYVLKGTATVTDGEEVIVVEEGGMNLCKNLDRHGVENCGTENLELLALIMTA